MSDTPPDISRFFFPTIAALFVAGVIFVVSGEAIVAAIAAFIVWRIVSNMTGSLDMTELKHSNPTPKPLSGSVSGSVSGSASGGAGGGAGAADGISVNVGNQARQALMRKLAKLREQERRASAASGGKQTRATERLKRAEAKLNGALAKKQDDRSPSSTDRPAATRVTTNRTPSTDPNAWWLEAFAALDARMVSGALDDDEYDREYERIVRQRESQLRQLDVADRV